MSCEMITVICADDEDYMRVFYKTVFTNRNYNLLIYDNGADVLDYCREQLPDLLILDIDMPGATGLDVCRRMRQHSLSTDIPIIIVSARDTESDIVNALSIGADEYIVKPFKPAELLAKSTAILRKRSRGLRKDEAVTEGNRFAGRYMIRRQLGKGGFGKVFLATDESSDNRAVAIKVFEVPAELDNFMALFLREAYGLSKLQHDNIVTLLDFGKSHDLYFLVTEYMEGMSLAGIVEKKGPMTEENAAYIAYEAAQALEYLADRNMVHCDIKPENIMIAKNGDLRLIDFGMAKQLLDVDLTPEDMFVGTPQFIAPELIFAGGTIDIRADVFSLGVTIYYIVTGKNLFQGISSEEILTRRIEEEEVQFQFTDRGIDERLRDLIKSMVSHESEDRPTPHEVVIRLRDIVSAK